MTQAADLKNLKLPWLVRCKAGNIVFFGTLMVLAAFAFCIVLSSNGVPLGLVEWAFLLVGAALGGSLSGFLFWYLYSQPQLAKLARSRRVADEVAES